LIKEGATWCAWGCKEWFDTGGNVAAYRRACEAAKAKWLPVESLTEEAEPSF
jgi:hypothetical protein